MGFEVEGLLYGVAGAAEAAMGEAQKGVMEGLAALRKGR